MPNPQKAKGDRAEVALVTYLQAWWPNVRRTTAGGEKDLGDLSGLIDRDGDEWCVQVADRKILLAQHGAVLVKASEAAEQADRLGAPFWCLIVKRAGMVDPGNWFVWLPVLMLGETFDAGGWWPLEDAAPDDLACITVRAWVALIAPEPF